MANFYFIWFDLRCWISSFELFEFLFLFSVYNIGIVPGLLGFFLCRHYSIRLRMILSLFLFLVGCCAVLEHAHGFGVYLTGNIIYIFMCVLGLYLRAKKNDIVFWIQPHHDWLTVLFGTIVQAIIFIPPSA